MKRKGGPGGLNSLHFDPMHAPSDRPPPFSQIDISKWHCLCNSEDGRLKTVLLHPPDFLDWSPSTAINPLQRSLSPPAVDVGKREHCSFIDALRGEGVEVILSPPSPHLTRAIYCRDAVFVIGETPFSAKFKYPVRAPESELIIGVKSPWRPQDIIEGGDVIVFPDAVVVGIGERSNLSSIRTLATNIDREVWPISLTADTLHLDYTMTIGGRGNMRTMICCMSHLATPGMVDLLIRRFDIANLLIIPEDGFTKGKTNVLFIDPETIISTTDAFEVNLELRKIGFRVIELDFSGILRGHGAPRCCSAPIIRED